MSNGEDFIDALELEKQLQAMNDRELSEFTARQIYDLSGIAHLNQHRIVSLEKRVTKAIGLVGTFGTFVGAVIVSLINYFRGG